MSEFRLIAIRPLESCDIQFSKILKKDKVYSFYNDYNFSNYRNNNRTVIINSRTNQSLYNITTADRNNVSINISAIVGANGAGKSTLVELIYLFCYNLSAIEGVLYDEDRGYKLNKNHIVPSVAIELFYEINERLYLIKLDEEKIDKYSFNKGKGFFEKTQDRNLLNEFFYSIAINYSHHSLNRNVIGDWVDKLFHKNDGYQTPIVINPFRSEGNIDHNNEEYLAKSRFLTNVLGEFTSKSELESSPKNILDGKIAHSLKVEIDPRKFDYTENGKPVFKLLNTYGDQVLPYVYRTFFKAKKYYPSRAKLKSYTHEYILKKLKSISEKYEPYRSRFKFLFEGDQFDPDRIGDLEGFLLMLKNQTSHITFKLRQAINFLDNDLFINRRGSGFELTVNYLSTELQKRTDKTTRLIDILPPSFFKIDLKFLGGDKFSYLSSGEKQRIFSISSLIYHLKNLSSTNHVNYKYRYVNVIFDELEMYFHPELQRNLVNDILENLKRSRIKNIYAINFLFITHSPFILSDIPASNILFLSKDEKDLDSIKEIQNTGTFGGNIIEILANGFFLNDGFTGEFAKNKIQEIIDRLKEDRLLESGEQEYLKERINLVGEPFLKEKLDEMLISKLPYDEKIKEYEKRIEDLKNDKNRKE